MILLVVFGLTAGYILWSLICLEINYKRASSMGIPLVRLPIDSINILFQVLESHVWRILDLLPFEKPETLRFMRRGWFFQDKARSFQKYGPIWAHVTPCDIHVHICDPEAILQILSRRGEFIRPVKLLKLLEVYGPCISTAETADWPRHRKVLAAPFNESIMDFVWRESFKQTRDMMEYWTTEHARSGIPSVSKDTRHLSLNVLASTGFHRSQSFRGSHEDVGKTEGGILSYRDALQTVLDNIILLMLIPPRFLQKPWIPPSLRKIGVAAADFKKHMIRMVDQETDAINRGEKGSGGLMTSFMRALNAHDQDDDNQGPKGLSVEEIFGNIFVINFAGHDSTANTLSFSFHLLAVFPEVQEWVAAEVRSVLSGLKEVEYEYKDLFPRLVRCRAVLLETIRLFPPIMSIPKCTNEQHQSLTVGDRTIIFPPLTVVCSGVLATQTHPEHWPDPLQWKPMRWIQSKPSAISQRVPAEEGLITPAQGTFVPWSYGHQNCPGEKFISVEFIAVLACLMEKNRLRIEKKPGESFESMRERVLGVVNDCDAQMLLRMKNPDRVRIFCEPVE